MVVNADLGAQPDRQRLDRRCLPARTRLSMEFGQRQLTGRSEQYPAAVRSRFVTRSSRLANGRLSYRCPERSVLDTKQGDLR